MTAGTASNKSTTSSGAPDAQPEVPSAARGGSIDLTSGPIGSALLAFALPTLLASALQSASGSLDAILVGKLLGSTALAATANGNIVMFLVTSFVFGFGMAATIYIGQAFGKSDIDQARRIAGTVIGLFVPLSIATAVLGFLLCGRLLSLLGTDPDVMPLALAYLKVIFINMPATMIMTLIMMALRGSGDSRTPLLFVGLSVAINASLSPFLIAGYGPFPQLGIGGAALGTLIGNALSLVGLVAYIYARDLPLRLRKAELRYVLPDPAILKLMAVKGSPIGLQMIVVSTAALTMLRLVNAVGVAETAAYAAVQQVWGYVQLPAMALGAAASAMAAQNIGADRWDRVATVSRRGVEFNILLTGTIVLALSVFAAPILSLFLAGESSVLQIGMHILRIATWGYIAFGITFVLFGTVRANGQVVGPLIVLAISLYPVRVGFAVGAQGWLGTDALWWSFPVALVSACVMAVLLYRYGGWRDGKLLPESLHVASLHLLGRIWSGADRDGQSNIGAMPVH